MKTVLEDVEFTAKAYPKALAAYENENGASVVMMPEDCNSIGTVVVKKMETSGEIVSLDADSRCDGRFCSYCEALRKAGVPVKEIPHETGGHHWGQWQDFPASMFDWIASLHAE